jgi:hypothetical protein
MVTYVVVQKLCCIFFPEKKKVPGDGVAHRALNCGVDVGYDLLGSPRPSVEYPTYEDELREKGRVIIDQAGDRNDP